MKNKKIIQVPIIILIIIAVLIFGMLWYFLQKSKTTNSEEIQNNTEYVEENIEIQDSRLKTINQNLREVSDNVTYFTVKNCIDKYFNMVSSLNISDQYEMNENEKKEMRKEIIANLFNILDDEFVKDFNINQDSISKLYNSYNDVEFLITRMYETEISSSVKAYVVYGKYVESAEQYKAKNYGLIVKIDSNNHTFSIYLNNYLEQNDYLNLKEDGRINLKNDDSIKNKDYNVYYEKDIDISNQKIAEYYLYLYRKMTLVDINNSYNLIDENYRNIRFENVQGYNQFINQHGDMFSKLLSKYKITNFPKYTQVVCFDEAKNYYIFNVEKPGNYTVLLDTYTVLLPQDEAKYEDSGFSARCSFNINRFIRGINNQNYNFSYSILEEEFKNSKFRTKEDFVKYVQTYFFKDNKIEFSNFSMVQDGVYKYNVKITDATGNSDKVNNLIFNVNLKTGTNFTLSFSIE